MTSTSNNVNVIMTSLLSYNDVGKEDGRTAHLVIAWLRQFSIRTNRIIITNVRLSHQCYILTEYWYLHLFDFL